MTELASLKQTTHALIDQLLRSNADITNLRGLDWQSLKEYAHLRRRLRLSAHRLKEIAPTDYHLLFDVQHPDILHFSPVPAAMQVIAIRDARRTAEQRQRQTEPEFYCNGINFQ